MRYEWKQINFLNELYEYRNSLLTTAAQDTLDRIMACMEKNSKDVKWIYFAVVNLGNRSILQSKFLFTYQPFIDEVNALVEEYDAGREQQALAILREDKSNFDYQNAMFPSLSNREYKMGVKAAFKLRELYGDEPVPQKFMATAAANV